MRRPPLILPVLSISLFFLHPCFELVWRVIGQRPERPRQCCQECVVITWSCSLMDLVMCRFGSHGMHKNEVLQTTNCFFIFANVTWKTSSSWFHQSMFYEGASASSCLGTSSWWLHTWNISKVTGAFPTVKSPTVKLHNQRTILTP